MAVSIGSILMDLRASTKGLRKDFRGATRDFRRAGNTAGVAFAAGFSISAVLIAREFNKFQKAFSEVKTITKGTAKELKALENQTIALSAAIGTDLTDTTKGLYQAISASVPKGNVIGFMALASKAAIAGVTEVEVAVDGMTSVINGFQLDMSKTKKVSDVMFKTVERGKTTFEELSSAIGKVAPVANASNVDFEEMFASLATITKQGVATTDAVTQLRAALKGLTAPTAQMDALFKELEVSSGQALINQFGFVGALEQLRTVASDQELQKAMGRMEGYMAAIELTGPNAATFVEDLAAMHAAAGSTEKAFDIMQNSADAFMRKLKALVVEQVIPAISQAYDDLIKKSGGVAGAHLVMEKQVAETFGNIFKGVGLLANAYAGWSVLLQSLRLGIIQFYGGLLTANIIIIGGFEDMVNVFIDGINEVTNLYNQTVGRLSEKIQIPVIDRFRSETKKALEETLASVAGVEAELKAGLINTLMTPLPTTVVDEWLKKVQVSMEAARAEVKASIASLSGTMEDSKVGTPSPVSEETTMEMSAFFTESITAARTLFDVIENGAMSVQDSIRGLITGTMSWNDALTNVATTIFTTITNALIQVAAQWLASQLAVTLGTEQIQQQSAVRATAQSVAQAAVITAAWIPAAIAASIATFGAAAWTGLGSFVAATALGTAAAVSIGLIGGAAMGAVGVSGQRAHGGDVTAGDLFRINERGPEFFRPSMDGEVVPLSKINLANEMGGGENITVNQTFTGGVTQTDLDRRAQTIKKETTEGIMEGISRGGSFRRAFQR